MSVTCCACNCTIKDGNGRYHYPDGVRCTDCGVNYTGWKDTLSQKATIISEKTMPEQLKESIISGTTLIGNYHIPNSLLDNYQRHVSYLKRSIKISVWRDDPLIIQRALEQREKIHREIFSHTGLVYHADEKSNKESRAFNLALDDWLVGKIGDGV